MPLKRFIIRDPKTRKIHASNFRDRVVYHALVNILEPIFEKTFIYDSYANRKGKGSLKALQRFDHFKRIVSKNNTIDCYVLKSDIKHYFEEVAHEILLSIIKRKINDGKVVWLIKQILNNFDSKTKGIGMPLGNLTSQFFANVYLNELDYFVKQILRAKYYIRYVDDFVILHHNKESLKTYKERIERYLKSLKLELHPDKCKIIPIKTGVNFLGFRVFYHHKLLRKSNIRKFERKLLIYKRLYDSKVISYDKVYNSIIGWIGYAEHGNTYNLRKKLLRKIEGYFPEEISSIEIKDSFIK